MSDTDPRTSRSLRGLALFSSHGDPLASLILAVPVVILYLVVSALYGIVVLTAAAITAELWRTRTASPDDAQITRRKALASYWWIGLVPVDAVTVYARTGDMPNAFGRTVLNRCLCGLIYGGSAVSIHLTKQLQTRNR